MKSMQPIPEEQVVDLFHKEVRRCHPCALLLPHCWDSDALENLDQNTHYEALAFTSLRRERSLIHCLPQQACTKCCLQGVMDSCYRAGAPLVVV